MFFLVVFFAIISLNNAEDNETEAIVCNGIIFDGTYYEKELLYRGKGKSNNLFMYNPTDELFFSHTIYNEMTQSYIPTIKACHLQNKTCRDIKGIYRGFSTAYDRANDNIYFGGFTGLYRYDKLTKSAKLFGKQGEAIWTIYIYDTFYYVEYPSQQLNVLVGGRFIKSNLFSNVLNFLANRKYFYFSNSTGLYFIDRRRSRKTNLLADDIYVRQIVEDDNGKMYFCADDGIYMEDRPFYKLRRVADLKYAFGLTFIYNPESNVQKVQVIYSHTNAIYKLVPSQHADICLEALLDPDDTLLRGKLSDVRVDINLKF